MCGVAGVVVVGRRCGRKGRVVAGRINAMEWWHGKGMAMPQCMMVKGREVVA